MQPHDINQRPEESNTDGRRDAERYSSVNEAVVAISQAINLANGSVRLAEPNKLFNLSASLSGKGGLAG